MIGDGCSWLMMVDEGCLRGIRETEERMRHQYLPEMFSKFPNEPFAFEVQQALALLLPKVLWCSMSTADILRTLSGGGWCCDQKLSE